MIIFFFYFKKILRYFFLITGWERETNLHDTVNELCWEKWALTNSYNIFFKNFICRWKVQYLDYIRAKPVEAIHALISYVLTLTEQHTFSLETRLGNIFALRSKLCKMKACMPQISQDTILVLAREKQWVSIVVAIYVSNANVWCKNSKTEFKEAKSKGGERN